MCRIAAYAGPPRPLSHLLFDQPRSLEVMAHSPRELRSGTVNVDGTGIVWFDPPGPDGAPPADARPLRYRTQLPPWGDQTLVELSPRLSSTVMLGSVRSTTAGIPQGQAFVHPFTSGDLAGTHNGWISNYRRAVARRLLAEVSDETFGELDGMSDANALFLLAVDAYRAGAPLLDAAREATARAAEVTAAAGETATLTLALADRTGVAAVNAATGRPANSLYVRAHEGAHLLASEPLDDDPSWTRVGEGDGVLLTPTQLIHREDRP